MYTIQTSCGYLLFFTTRHDIRNSFYVTCSVKSFPERYCVDLATGSGCLNICNELFVVTCLISNKCSLRTCGTERCKLERDKQRFKLQPA